MHLNTLYFLRHDFQFFNTQRLSELYEKEVRYLMVGVQAHTFELPFYDRSQNITPNLQ